MALLNEEQAMLKDQAEAWVSEQAPVASFRAMRDSGVEAAYEPTTWAAMVDMGWTVFSFRKPMVVLSLVTSPSAWCRNSLVVS